jgi:hypothetical protein
MLLPVLQSQSEKLGGLTFLVIGLGAVSLGRDPNGIANHLFAWGRWLRDRLPAWTAGSSAPVGTADGAGELASDLTAELSAVRDPERVAGHGVA